MYFEFQRNISGTNYLDRLSVFKIDEGCMANCESFSKTENLQILINSNLI